MYLFCDFYIFCAFLQKHCALEWPQALQKPMTTADSLEGWQVFSPLSLQVTAKAPQGE